MRAGARWAGWAGGGIDFVCSDLVRRIWDKQQSRNHHIPLCFIYKLSFLMGLRCCGVQIGELRWPAGTKHSQEHKELLSEETTYRQNMTGAALCNGVFITDRCKETSSQCNHIDLYASLAKEVKPLHLSTQRKSSNRRSPLGGP